MADKPVGSSKRDVRKGPTERLSPSHNIFQEEELTRVNSVEDAEETAQSTRRWGEALFTSQVMFASFINWE